MSSRARATALSAAALACVAHVSFAPVSLAEDKPAPKAPTEALASKSDDPGAVLIARERDVWTLEGRLVADADLVLHSADAKQALTDLATASDGEARARGWLRAHRSAEIKKLATAFVGELGKATRELLDRAAKESATTSEDVFMDYLTYDGLVDLAIMRYGYKNWKAGRYEGDVRGTADSFFSLVSERPAARRGIKVLAADDASIEVDVFGAHVRAEVKRSSVELRGAVGKVGVVTWESTYERLRATVRGTKVSDELEEELEHDGKRFQVSYAAELDEYLRFGATSPWATMLALLSADDVANLYAGVAASGGLEQVREEARDPAKLAPEAKLGRGEKTLHLRVADARRQEKLAGTKARRGAFLLVTLELTSSLGQPLEAPSSWFRLATSSGEFPEIGVTRPGLAASLLAASPVEDAKLLGLPTTTIASGAKTTLVLVYDVPADLASAALVFGSDEAALKVTVSK